jgi:molybdopterin molybdotransferase
VAAGSEPVMLLEGTAARIFTGAEIPPGADTVVMQENCVASEGQVQIRVCPARGTNIRPRAQDVASGQKVLLKGSRLRPQDCGLMASLGVSGAMVFKPLKVAVLSNGSELVEPGLPIGPGQIYNSNRYLLGALMQAWGFEVVDMGIAKDDPVAIRRQLLEAGEKADVIISSGGVSVGEEDHIKEVVESLGAIDLWKVSIKPGKPFAFGKVGNTPFMGLPGNPASVLVTCLVIARAYLFNCQGNRQTRVEPLRVVAQFNRDAQQRTEFLRVKSGPGGVQLYPQQSSGTLLSSVWGDGLAIQAEGDGISIGDEIDFLPYALLI